MKYNANDSSLHCLVEYVEWQKAAAAAVAVAVWDCTHTLDSVAYYAVSFVLFCFFFISSIFFSSFSFVFFVLLCFCCRIDMKHAVGLFKALDMIKYSNENAISVSHSLDFVAFTSNKHLILFWMPIIKSFLHSSPFRFVYRAYLCMYMGRFMKNFYQLIEILNFFGKMKNNNTKIHTFSHQFFFCYFHCSFIITDCVIRTSLNSYKIVHKNSTTPTAKAPTTTT